jgi:hypothetical protein
VRQAIRVSRQRIRRIDDKHGILWGELLAGLGEPCQPLFIRPSDRQFQHLTAGGGQRRQERSVKQRAFADARTAVQDHQAAAVNQFVEFLDIAAPAAKEMRGQRWRQKRARADERVAPVHHCRSRPLRLLRIARQHGPLTGLSQRKDAEMQRA